MNAGEPGPAGLTSPTALAVSKLPVMQVSGQFSGNYVRLDQVLDVILGEQEKLNAHNLNQKTSILTDLLSKIVADRGCHDAAKITKDTVLNMILKAIDDLKRVAK